MPVLSFNIDKKFDNTLSDLVSENDEAHTKADVVQRAVATYQYFRSLPEGAKIQVVDNQGKVLEQDVAVP